ncbi:TFIIB-type zinc ribbon-containing protein [Aurantimonas marina]|uniref:TFIIB-type zinc ribbon-containing protein n=1 Tax=Aurantimonas marina TaxID=2780508 RepID=UPI001E301EED|nr:zf-TFIIB domain-containing protein [Aurantimonas marina]
MPDKLTSMLCPVCKVALTMSDRQGVEIDYCPQCRGVWLDRGELDKIFERSAAETVPAQPTPGPDRRDYDDENYRGRGEHGKHGGYRKYGGYRRKSWLQELFD